MVLVPALSFVTVRYKKTLFSTEGVQGISMIVDTVFDIDVVAK